MKIKPVLVASLSILFMSTLVSATLQEELPRMRRTRENIITLMLLRMTQILELDEEQTAKIYPLVTRIEKEKTEIHKQIQNQMRGIRVILKEEVPDQEELKRKIEKLRELRDALKIKDREMEAQLEKHLTVIQQAKFLMFANDFYRELRDNLERARKMKQRMQEKK